MHAKAIRQRGVSLEHLRGVSLGAWEPRLPRPSPASAPADAPLLLSSFSNTNLFSKPTQAWCNVVSLESALPLSCPPSVVALLVYFPFMSFILVYGKHFTAQAVCPEGRLDNLVVGGIGLREPSRLPNISSNSILSNISSNSILSNTFCQIHSAKYLLK